MAVTDPKAVKGQRLRILNVLRLRSRVTQTADESYGTPGRGRSLGISVTTVIAVLILWTVMTREGWIPELFLPGPVVVYDRLANLTHTPYAGATLGGHILWSLFRVFSAFVAACVFAIPTGIAMGVNRVARGVFDPLVEFYRPIPPLAYLPLTIIWLGIGEVQKIVLIYLAVFAPVVLNTRAGVRSVAIEQIQVAYSLGASRRQVIWHVILKGALPEILTGLRIGIGFGWTTLVAAEMVAASVGIGHMVLSAANFLNTPVVVVGILIIGIIAYVFDLFMRYLEHVLVPWKGQV